MAKKLAHISEDHSREQTVYEHLTGTAELAKQFAAAFGAEEDGYLLGLLHDIGKYRDAFPHRLDGGACRACPKVRRHCRPVHRHAARVRRCFCRFENRPADQRDLFQCP